MITINKIYIENKENKSRLCAKVKYNGIENILWYEVEKEYEKYLTPERADAFLCALLLFAIQNRQDIRIVDTPVSSKLLFNIRTNIIPAYNIYGKNKKKITIECKETEEKLYSEGMNGTGISRGVDSFSTIYDMRDSKFNINVLTFFNVGSHGDYGGEESRMLFLKRMKISKKFSEENNFRFLYVDSNISEFLNQVFVESHTYRSMSAVLAVQKLFNNYYYSSGYPLNEFEFNDKAPAKMDIFLLNMLSNENISLYSSGCLDNRLDKVKKIAKDEIAQKNLNVCFKDETNCCKCEKCIRTIFELYSINCLNNFKEVFDIKRFYDEKNWYEKQFMIKYYEGKQDYIDTYNEMKKNNIKIKFINKIKAILSVIKHKIIK